MGKIVPKTSSSTTEKLNRLKNKEFRKAYANSVIEQGLAYQIKSLRLAKRWSQKELADRIGAKSQSIVSRLEDPSYGKHSLQTLEKISAAFDIALSVRFVSFGQLLKQQEDLTPKSLAVPSFDEECQNLLELEAHADTYAEGVLHDIASSSKFTVEYLDTSWQTAVGTINGNGIYEASYGTE